MKRASLLTSLGAVLCLASCSSAQEMFSQIVGPLQVGSVQRQAVLSVPYITWGGDSATFLANGGLETKSNSGYGQRGLKLKLTAGDDFVQQVKDYVSGKTPFLRGTFRMLGQASEVIGSDPRTKPVIILQLSWSAGDHLVAREDLKTLNDLKSEGKKVRIACQQGGPHVGLLYDALSAVQLTKDDVEIVFVSDLTGEQGPAEAFRRDRALDACCVITPDMIGLTGGLESTGTGAEGTVPGAHVLVSTQQMSRSIADVYAVRSDWFRGNRDTVEKFVAGYLKATEEVIEMRDDFESSQRMSADYRSLLAMCQQIFGKDVLPTLEVDAHGLLLDCNFVGLPGQIAFFEQRGNLSGFDPKLSAALDLAMSWGYAASRNGFDTANWDFQKLAAAAGVKYVVPDRVSGAETVAGGVDDTQLDDAIVSFTISFEPNQQQFSVDRYGAEFNRALQSASTFGGAAVVIRGHSDPTLTLKKLLMAGAEKGILRRSGSSGNYRYYLKTPEGSRELDLTQTDRIVELIKSGAFSGTAHRPLQTMQAALNLSIQRAESVKQAIIDYAEQRGLNVNLQQLQPVGAGIAEPLISKPTSLAEAKQNMRVEFRIVRVDPETLTESDFDF